MGAVFTPGLKVAARTVVRKDRRLPMAGEVLVAVGDAVRADQVVARTELPGKVFPLNVANRLGVDPSRLGELMCRGEGDRVEAGEVIATTPGLFGWFRSTCTAPVTGTIESISRVTGQVIFQADPIPVEVDAYIDGRVVEIHEEEGCVVQAVATLVQGIFGLGGEVRGPLRLAGRGPDLPLRPEDLVDDHAGSVVVGGAHAPLETIRAARELGVAALVTGGMDYDDIARLVGHEIGVAITGGERIGLTLVVTEGFGRIRMAPATWERLGERVGARASVNGATQIRAGVIRPEVVVVHPDAHVPEEAVEEGPPRGIQVGDTVRGIRTPWFGRIGRVVELPVHPVELPTGSPARIMRVDFDGEVVEIPRANVEVIES